MKKRTVLLIARQFWQNAFNTKALYGTLAVMLVIAGYAAYSGWKTYADQQAIRQQYQHEVRERWESNPDKHPHRMAHYGSFAFRKKHPLSVFDFGLESFTGNAVYLEAHKQNSINFSEASLSTGLLRFGEISMAMLLQVLLPLFIVFLGFSAVSADRENGTLKVILTQGATWKDIIAGRSLGLMALALLIVLPVMIVTAILLLIITDTTADAWFRFGGIVIAYLVFLQVVSVITVLISAASASSKAALMKLLGLWLMLAVLMPRTTQALGSYIFPSPSKIEFETAVEEDILKQGDSHNPDDPHYVHLRDSVLKANGVDSVQHLSFNYSGFVMHEGERISATIYNRHQQKLLATYGRQNGLARLTAFVNPFAAIRAVSMALAGTDFMAYVQYQNESEAYRYQMAQKMNQLQMEFISNKKPGPDDKPATISREHWKELPDFHQKFVPVAGAVSREGWSVLALLVWSVLSIVLVIQYSKNAKVIL